MRKRKWTDSELITAVQQSLSYAEVLRKLGLRVAGGNYDAVKRRVMELKLNTTHMTGQVWNQGERFRAIKSARPLNEILVEHSTFINSNHLRERLLSEGLKEYKCECCNNTEWLGKPIKLELHHINGIKSDQRVENLQILCPNCHSYTENYRGNKKKGFEQQVDSRVESLTETPD